MSTPVSTSKPPPSSERLADAKLGKYALIAEIARGGMGIVYLAHAGSVAGFNKLVVLKELKPELANEESFREMFLDEARLAARLNHRNIVQTNEVGSDDGRYFIAMDYLEGGSLNQVVKAFAAEKPLLLNTQLRIFAETLAGLHYAHELADFDGSLLGIVHRDVCPQNIFITFDGQVKIVDFGVAKARNRLNETQAGTLKGRVAYMSPEHIAGATIDRRADVFAAGVMLWEAVANQRMWGRQTEMEILKALVGQQIPSLPEDVDVAPEDRKMVARATAADPAERYATAHEFRQQIEQYLLRAQNVESLADVGQRLSVAFAEDRAKLRRVVEEHVTRHERLSVTDDEPMNLPRLSLKGIPNPMSERSLSQRPVPAASQSAPSFTSSVGTTPITAELAPASTMKPSRAPLFAGGAAVVVAAVVVAYVLISKAPPTAAGAPTVASQATPAAAAPPSAVARGGTTQNDAPSPLVDVTISATPTNAAVVVDGVQVSGNPYHAQFKRGAHHIVAANAAGYVSKTQDFTFDDNTQASIALERVVVAPGTAIAYRGPAAGGGAGKATAAVAPPPVTAEPAPPPPPPPPPPPQTAQATPPPAPTDVNPNGGKAPLKKIDPNNPYATQ